MNVLLVAAGAAVGAPLRYLLDRAVQARHGTGLPWGTFTVNVLATFVLGLVTGLVAGGSPDWLRTLVGIGFCGALSTWSTFGFETLRLAEERSGRMAAANVAVSVAVGLGAAALGAAVAGLAGA